jgi:hypothetical protein
MSLGQTQTAPSASFGTAALSDVPQAILSALYLEWLSLPETEWQVLQAVEEIRHDPTLSTTGSAGSSPPSASDSTLRSPDRSAAFRHLTVSPNAAPHSPRSPPPPRSPRSPLSSSSHHLSAAAAAAALHAANNNSSPPPSPTSPKSPLSIGSRDTPALPSTFFTSPTSPHPSTLLPAAAGGTALVFASPEKPGAGSGDSSLSSLSLNVELKAEDAHALTSGSRPTGSAPRSPSALLGTGGRHERSNSGSYSPTSTGRPRTPSRAAAGPSALALSNESIQPFYFPDGQPPSPTSKQRELVLTPASNSMCSSPPLSH